MKKIISRVLLFALAVLLVSSALLGFETYGALCNINYTDISEEHLPGALVLGSVLASLTVWGGFVLGEFLICFTGLIVAAVNLKIAKDHAVFLISKAFLIFYLISALVILIGTAVFILEP